MDAQIGSENTLHAVLGAVVAPGAPIVDTLLDQAVHMALCIVQLQALLVRE